MSKKRKISKIFTGVFFFVTVTHTKKKNRLLLPNIPFICLYLLNHISFHLSYYHLICHISLNLYLLLLFAIFHWTFSVFSHVSFPYHCHINRKPYKFSWYFLYFPVTSLISLLALCTLPLAIFSCHFPYFATTLSFPANCNLTKTYWFSGHLLCFFSR